MREFRRRNRLEPGCQCRVFGKLGWGVQLRRKLRHGGLKLGQLGQPWRKFERRAERKLERRAKWKFERRAERKLERRAERKFERRAERKFERRAKWKFERRPERKFERGHVRFSAKPGASDRRI